MEDRGLDIPPGLDPRACGRPGSQAAGVCPPGRQDEVCPAYLACSEVFAFFRDVVSYERALAVPEQREPTRRVEFAGCGAQAGLLTRFADVLRLKAQPLLEDYDRAGCNDMLRNACQVLYSVGSLALEGQAATSEPGEDLGGRHVHGNGEAREAGAGSRGRCCPLRVQGRALPGCGAALHCQRMSKAAFMEPLPALSKLDWKAVRHSSSRKSPVRSPAVG